MVSAITKILSCAALLSASHSPKVLAAMGKFNAAQVSTVSERVEIVRYNQARTAKVRIGDRLKFAIWNVHKFTDDLALRTVDYFSHVADFVFIEESMVGGRYERFFKNLGTMQWLSAQSFSKGQSEFTGVTTGTRFAVANSYGVRSNAREPILKTPKMFVVTEIPIEGVANTLMVVNIHGINFVGNGDYASQLIQLEAVLKSHAGPIVLAGDFNLWSIDRAIMVHTLAKRVGLDYVPLTDDHRGLPLDQILVRGLRPHEARVMVDLEGSDHLPLWAELELL